MSEKEMKYPTPEELAAGVSELQKTVSENIQAAAAAGTLIGNEQESTLNTLQETIDLPLGSFFLGRNTSIRVLPSSAKVIANLSPKALREHEALHVFYNRYYGTDTLPSILVYYGFVNEKSTVYVRFVKPDGVMATYCCLEEDYEKVQAIILGEGGPDDLLEQNFFRYKRFWKFGSGIVDSAPIELPLSWIRPAETNEMDGLYDGDFDALERLKETYSADLREHLKRATELATKVAYLMTERDHDLMLSFKGVNGFMEMNVGLDRIYPLLPESGEISLGDKAVSVEDWKDYAANIQVSVKRMVTLNKKINRLIAKYTSLVQDHPVIQRAWKEHLKIEGMAASHFLKMIYTLNPNSAVGVVQEVANEVLQRLHNHGGNIGLDLNEWVVYSYEGEGRPTRVVTPELNFTEMLYKRYTQSFVEALYAYLLRCQSQYIKPYTYREYVSGNDGIAVGSIRPA